MEQLLEHLKTLDSDQLAEAIRALSPEQVKTLVPIICAEVNHLCNMALDHIDPQGNA